MSQRCWVRGPMSGKSRSAYGRGRLAGAVAMAAAYIGLVIALAVKKADAWPFAALLAVTGFAYLLGLSSYGSGEPGPEDEVTAGHQTRSPVNS